MADSDVLCLTGEVETDLVDSTKQRHELAEQSGAQTGDVHEGTLMGGEEAHVNLNRDARLHNKLQAGYTLKGTHALLSGRRTPVVAWMSASVHV